MVFQELEAALSSLDANHLYPTIRRKGPHSRSKASIFDVEREKERLYQSTLVSSSYFIDRISFALIIKVSFSYFRKAKPVVRTAVVAHFDPRSRLDPTQLSETGMSFLFTRPCKATA